MPALGQYSRAKIADGVMMRQCGGPVCRGKWKPWNEDHFHRYKGGFQLWCKVCMTKAATERQARERVYRGHRVERAAWIVETEPDAGVMLDRITAGLKRRRLSKGETMKEFLEMIRSMRGRGPSWEMSIAARAEHIVAMRATLHEKEADAATLAGVVKSVTRDYLNIEHGPTDKEVDKARASALNAAAIASELRQEIARLEGEQATAEAAERQADYEARVDRADTRLQRYIEKVAAAEASTLKTAADVVEMRTAQNELAVELGNDALAGLPWLDPSALLALRAWVSSDGVWPPGMKPGESPYVIGQRLRPVAEQLRELRPLILARVPRPEIDAEPEQQPIQEAAA